ncbi:MAG: Uma2 family endonuclease [Methylovulum sp.]|nr:Uma2 family endonuclease [Methylovulum sp.]
MTETEYLRAEITADVKHEYIDGHVYAMSGAKKNHNLLSGNIFSNFRDHLKGTPCVTYMADMKVKAGGANYFYPDVVVDCNEATGDDYFTESPVIIVEVLSQATRKNDMTTKFLRYINIPTLKEYVLVEQDVVAMQIFRKNNDWKADYYCLGDSVMFESIGLTLTVEDIYERIDNRDMNEFRQAQQETALKDAL